MKCPRCGEELGLNNICICSILDNETNLSEEKHVNDMENNFNNQFINENSYNYNGDNYLNNQSINNTTEQSHSLYDKIDSNISREDFATFIGGNNANYYLKYLPEMKNNNNFLSWNWACFFLAPFWLLYRKLYSFAAIYLTLISICTRLTINIKGFAGIILNLAVYIGFAIFANSIYLNNCENNIKAIKTSMLNLSSTNYINKLQTKGGVNLAAPLILLGLYILIVILFINSVMRILFAF